MDIRFNQAPQPVDEQPADVEPSPVSRNPEQGRDQTMMESWRNSRLGRVVTAGLATLTMLATTEAGTLAFAATPVSGEGNVPARTAEPEADASAGKLVKPTAVMAAISKGINLIGRQTGFTMIRPKTASMSGNRSFIWGGKDSCRPGHNNDPILYFEKVEPNKDVGGICETNFPVRSVNREHYPPDYFTGTMNKISVKVEAANGVNIAHGDTKSIKATRTVAAFTYNCAAGPGNLRTLAINSQGKKVVAERCK